jgi:hypothetical protein
MELPESRRKDALASSDPESDFVRDADRHRLRVDRSGGQAGCRQRTGDCPASGDVTMAEVKPHGAAGFAKLVAAESVRTGFVFAVELRMSWLRLSPIST